MINRIVYINTFAWGSIHEMFNVSILLMCARIADSVEVRVTKKHFKIMFELVDNVVPLNITFKHVRTVGGDGKYQLLSRFFLGAILDFFYLLRTKPSDIIVFPYNNVISLYGINWLNRILKRRIMIFCHGEMEPIASNVNSKGLLSVLLYRSCIGFFLNKKRVVAPNLFFSVLGDNIKRNLLRFLSPNVYAHLISIDHPYIFSQVKAQPQKTAKLKIGTIGCMSEAKGQSEFADFVRMCRMRNISVDLFHVGKINDTNNELSHLGVIQIDSGKSLTRDEFRDKVSQLDYLLFFYPKDNYKITASGAVMDAIAYERPIIAIGNEYFVYFFEKFGTFGFLVDSIENMVDRVELLVKENIRQTFDFNTIRDKLKPEVVVRSFVDELKSIKFID